MGDMMQTIDTPTTFGIGLFDGIDAAALSEVTAVACTRLLRPGETLFEQGDDADSFFVVKAGSVKLLLQTSDGDVLTLRVLGPGDMVGGASALGAGTHQVSAVAVTETVTYEWRDALMASLMERHGRLALNALRLIATRLYDLQEQHRLLAVKKVERRIARALVNLIRHWGTRVGEGVHIDLPTSPEDLAETARTSVRAVSSALSRWESAGIIDTGGPRLLIRTPHALISIVNDFE